jgi:TPR repeat protein
MTKAAEGGLAIAQASLGRMHLRGEGVTRDYAEAARWFTRAAEQGSARAQDTLGTLYQHGRGVPRDEVAACMWFTLAMQQGHDPGSEHRAMIARTMDAAQVEEAERRARELSAARAAQVAGAASWLPAE